MNYIFQSKRLGFRRWKETDLTPFAEMNRDKAVMEYYPKMKSREETETFISRIESVFEEHGYGLYAVDELVSGEFIGYIGFWWITFDSPYTPFTEIGWKLKKDRWNLGYATEGAEACLHFGFDHLGLSEVYSMTSKINLRSERIMQKIGMKKITEFDHPNIEDGSPLKTHVLYNKKNYRILS